MTLRHRYLVAVPFVVLVVAVLVGGLVNTTDGHARIVDDLTDEGVKDATITHGVRTARTDADGRFVLDNLPRTSSYRIDAPGYVRRTVPTTTDEVRLNPLSLTVYAYDATKTENDRLKIPQARDVANTKILSTGNDSGQIVIAPHPGKDGQFLLCAEGFEAKQVTAHGVLMQVGLTPGGAGCPPLPTPSPAPSPTATP